MLPALLLAVTTLDPAAVTDDHLRGVMEALGSAIVDQHHGKRHWDPTAMPSGESTRQRVGGYTALASLSLIVAGHDAQQEPLKSALEYLADLHPNGTYTVAFRAQLWAELPEQWMGHLQRDVDRLLEAFHHETGTWEYVCEPVEKIARVSPSVRHAVMLALWSAAKRGIELPLPILLRVAEVTCDEQADDGGWSYGTTPGPSGSMTAAGVFTLVMIEDLLGRERRPPRVLRRTGSAITRGLAWLDRNFDPLRCPGGGRCSGFAMYWLYALERVALATGRRSLANDDWFRQAAAAAINKLCRQDGMGRWTTTGSRSTTRLRRQCFALMMLHRGRVPLAAAHLRRSSDDPVDPLLMRLTDSLSSLHEHPCAWQEVTLEDDPQAWLEAPMLVMTGSEAVAEITQASRDMAQHRRDPTIPRPRIELAARIRTHLELGGVLVAVSHGGRFGKSIKQLGHLVAPYASWKTARPDHDVFQMLDPVRGARPRVELLETAVRPLVILVHAGRGAHVMRSGGGGPLNSVLTNIWAMATERHPFPPRLAAPTPPIRIASPAPVVRLHLTGVPCANPEPGSGPALARWARAAGQTIELTADPALADVCVVAGSSAEDAAKAMPWIRSRCSRGQVVLAVQVGPGRAFVEPLNLAPTTHREVITGHGLPGGLDVSTVQWRVGSRQRGATRPALDLRCDESGNCWSISEDLLHALLDRPWWGVHGPERDTAAGLLWNLLQWAHARTAQAARTP